MDSGMKNLQTQVCTTLNLFNIMHLKELSYKVKEWNPNFWYINILHYPVEFDIQQIPRDIKKEIIQRLQHPEIYEQEIKTAVDYISRSPDYAIEDWHEALAQKIKSVDTVRDENFKDVFPELNEMIKIYE